MIPIGVTVNGRFHQLTIEPHRTLLDVLRHEIGLTGTKSNCQSGECGACTVLVDGRAINSCLYLAARTDGAEILTVEGLAASDDLHPIQVAFIENAAVQCGYCTPGFLMSIAAVTGDQRAPAMDELRAAVEGNICRCTGYTGISQALRQIADRSVEGP